MLGGFALCDMLHENWKRLLSDFIHHRENEVDEKRGFTCQRCEEESVVS
jgi:hypothetical protein